MPPDMGEVLKDFGKNVWSWNPAIVTVKPLFAADLGYEFASIGLSFADSVMSGATKTAGFVAGEVAKAASAAVLRTSELTSRAVQFTTHYYGKVFGAGVEASASEAGK